MRLIDADALLSELQEELEFDSPMHSEEENKYINSGLRIAIKDVKYAPTIDIKTEVAREIFAEIDNEFRKMISVANDGVNRGIVEQNKFTLIVNSNAVTILDTARLRIAELKNKYTKEGGV